MIIEYEITEFTKEINKIEILDTKNVFLKGTNPYDGLSTYFGIWTNENYLVIATLISNRTISYEYYKSKTVYTQSDIKRYLQSNKDIQIISKEEFKNELDKIKSILEI